MVVDVVEDFFCVEELAVTLGSVRREVVVIFAVVVVVVVVVLVTADVVEVERAEVVLVHKLSLINPFKQQ